MFSSPMNKAFSKACAMTFCLTVMPFFSYWASAEEQVLQLAGSFHEVFSEVPQVARGSYGVRVVGLRFDAPRRQFDPSTLRVLIGGGSARPGKICTRVITRDGRYFASAQYRIPGAIVPAPLLDFKTNYRDKLSTYGTDDFAMLGVSGGSCEPESSADFLIIRAGEASESKNLVVQIRGGDARVRAQLGQENKALGQAVLCKETHDASNVGFSKECFIPLPRFASNKRYQLSVAETLTDGQLALKTYSVIIEK